MKRITCDICGKKLFVKVRVKGGCKTMFAIKHLRHPGMPRKKKKKVSKRVVPKPIRDEDRKPQEHLKWVNGYLVPIE